MSGQPYNNGLSKGVGEGGGFEGNREEERNNVYEGIRMKN